MDFLERVQPAKTGLEITYNKRPLEYAKQYPQPVESWPRARESPRYSSPPPANQYGQVGILNARGKCGLFFFSFVIFCFLHAEFFNELKVFDFLKSKFELLNVNLYFNRFFYVDFAQKGTRNFFF